MDKKEFDEKIKLLPLADAKRNFAASTNYLLWSSSGGKCQKCSTDILEFDEERNVNATGYRAHIVSHASKKYRPRIADLYSVDTLKKLGLGKAKNGIFSNDNEMNKYLNILLLCHECHKYFDQPIENIEDHEDSAVEMLSYKKQVGKQLDSEFRLSISSKNNIQPFEDIIFGYHENIENLKNIKFDFNAVDELKKYSNTPVEENNEEDKQVINNINSKSFSMKTSNFVDTIKSITCEMSNYFAIDENQRNIKSFIFSIYLYNDNLTIKCSTTRKFAESIDNSKTHNELMEELKSEYSEILENKDTDWIINSSTPMDYLKDRADYKRLESLLLKSIYDFSNQPDKKYMDSFSVAYMARWGTGKTTLIRSLIKNNIKFFRPVEINLWHIANTIPKDKGAEDNLFIRNIVKEALTQMAGNPEVVSNYLDGMKKMTVAHSEANLSRKMMEQVLSLPSKQDEIEIIKERNKFLDQYIHTLSNFINQLFETSKKPIIFVFDDLDRITENKNIVEILDALVAFLNMKNCIFVIPVDESKVVKALYESKEGLDPNSFINKYFNYSIRAPFIPKLERQSTFKDVLDNAKMEINEDAKKYAIRLVNPTYRDMKDFLNNYNTNKSLYRASVISKNEVVDKSSEEKLLITATYMQQQFPLYADYLAEDISRKNKLKLSLNQYPLIKEYLENNLWKSKDIEAAKPLEEKWADGVAMDGEFWSAMSTKTIDTNETRELSEFVGEGVGNKNWHRKIMGMAEKIIELNDVVKISTFNEMELLVLWTMITQADIKTPEVIEFAKVSEIHNLLSVSDDDKFKAAVIEELESKTERYIDIHNEVIENRIINENEFYRGIDNLIVKLPIFEEKIKEEMVKEGEDDEQNQK